MKRDAKPHHQRSSSASSISAAFCLLFATAIFASWGERVEAKGAITGTASVIDADTIEIHGQRIRLHAVDAIESRQRCLLPDRTEWRCGTDAANALANKIGRAPVACQIIEQDRYGRLVATCFLKGENLNAWLVLNGWAVAYRQYGRDYVSHEQAAKDAKRGIWASRFVMPWVWRNGQ